METSFYPLKRVVLSWSGGIDSTAVLLNLLASGYSVHAFSVDLYDQRRPRFAERERAARDRISAVLASMKLPGSLSVFRIDGSALWSFSSPGGDEIPSRNKRIIDLLMARVVMPQGFMNLALGEYIGVDTWLVKNHVPLFDCDHRALSAYLLHEYGIEYRLISLQDFGESRYKHQRLSLGVNAWRSLSPSMGDQRQGEAGLMGKTTNCLRDVLQDCGQCYKCVERAAAFYLAGLDDPTPYAEDPKQSPRFSLYVRQMQGARLPGVVSFDPARDL